MDLSQRSTPSRRSKKILARLQTARNARAPRRVAPVIVKNDTGKKALSDLPGEIRNVIYEYALSPSSRTTIRLNGGGAVATDIALSLLATSKAVKKETTSLFYGANKFRIDLLYPLMNEQISKMTDAEFPEWRNRIQKPRLSRNLSMMGYKGLSMIRTFVFALHVRTVDTRAAELPAFPEVAHVTLELSLTSETPYYEFRICHNESEEARPYILCDLIETISPFVHQTFTVRGLRKLAKVDIIDIANQILARCILFEPGNRWA